MYDFLCLNFKSVQKSVDICLVNTDTLSACKIVRNITSIEVKTELSIVVSKTAGIYILSHPVTLAAFLRLEEKADKFKIFSIIGFKEHNCRMAFAVLFENSVLKPDIAILKLVHL